MNQILDYLESAAARFPDKKAVAMRDQACTYRELKAFAARLGAALRGLTEAGQPVGVMADRDTLTLPFFMGVLYAGCFYVPIDPEMPKDRLASVVSDADLKLIVGTEKCKARMAEIGFAGTYVTPDMIGEAMCAAPDVSPEDPLYMVYTSGSTGRPKGVLKSHGAMISFIETYCKTFEFTDEEIIGNQTPFYFDASAKDIYLMLKMGASMEIIPTELFMMPTMLIEYMNEKRISFASWVPTALSVVAQLCPFSLVKPETLKRLFFVGEVMPMKHLNKWREFLPEIQYVNLYGSSETAGICCYYVVEGEFGNKDLLPIGRPMSNCKAYLLGDEGLITGPDRIGELYLVTDALADGYYHDPEKTAAAFMVKDFGEGPVRCLKTGDLARYDEKGNLMFAARTDAQIKHMGHRIELGEIEAVAGALPEIGRCCCLYNADKRRIVLFVQLTEGVTLTGQAVKSLLRPRFSPYMLPEKVVVMEHLPLNANGKIDRQTLKQQI